MDTTKTSSAAEEVITLGGGCFWCVEAIFDELKGVNRVESGYSGGTVANPGYQAVCSGKTGHTEVIQVWFDPRVISLKDILHIFFTVHDPTTLNRQGNDVGTQYRSAIFYCNVDQKAVAEEVISEVDASKLWSRTIVTEVIPFSEFYQAEDYHRDYFKLNANQSYCQLIIAPKVAKFREEYRARLKR